MIYTNSDGGSRGNPGEAAIGVILRDDEKIIKTYKERIGKTTNNVAEYKGIIRALEMALKQHSSGTITCIMDSELVVKQLQGEYSVTSDLLKPLFLTVKELEKSFKKVTYKHVNRSDKFQKQADRLVNQALDEK